MKAKKKLGRPNRAQARIKKLDWAMKEEERALLSEKQRQAGLYYPVLIPLPNRAKGKNNTSVNRAASGNWKAMLHPTANDKQVGGDHYKTKTIQPWDAIVNWELGFLDGCAVKYLARWRKKNGVEDLKKAAHYLEKLLEVEEAKVKCRT